MVQSAAVSCLLRACLLGQLAYLALHHGRMPRRHMNDDTPTPASLRHMLAAVHVLSTQVFISCVINTQITVLDKGAHTAGVQVRGLRQSRFRTGTALCHT